jgi:hypothetical protein
MLNANHSPVGCWALTGIVRKEYPTSIPTTTNTTARNVRIFATSIIRIDVGDFGAVGLPSDELFIRESEALDADRGREASISGPESIPMRWNEQTLRRAETVIAVVVIALLIVAYLVSKVR